MKGHLTLDLTPYIIVAIGYREEECIVDTGFSGAVYLSEDKIAELNLLFLTSAPMVLADQTKVVADVFEMVLDWFSESRRVTVVSGPVGCETLVGMELLKGCRIELDDRTAEVRIESIG